METKEVPPRSKSQPERSGRPRIGGSGTPRELHYRIIVDAATELPIGSPSISSVDPARRHSGKEREEIGLSGRRPMCLDMARNGSSIREPRSPEVEESPEPPPQTIP